MTSHHLKRLQVYLLGRVCSVMVTSTQYQLPAFWCVLSSHNPWINEPSRLGACGREGKIDGHARQSGGWSM